MSGKRDVGLGMRPPVCLPAYRYRATAIVTTATVSSPATQRPAILARCRSA